MDYKRILTIQDISCVGQCSMTVALPILSACGQETVILPSAVLSTHTGGFSTPAIRDLTDHIPAVCAHWEKEGILFDGIYTGYLGSIRQIGLVAELAENLTVPGGKLIVDPAMADHGKLYKGFDQAYAEAMGNLCRKADVILPNITEACMLTGTEYRESYDESYVLALVEKLHSAGIPCVILTGVGYHPGETGVLISRQGRIHHSVHPRIDRPYHGTGDIFSSVLAGAFVLGIDRTKALKIASDYTAHTIAETLKNPENPWYGVDFEATIPELVDSLKKRCNYSVLKALNHG